MLEFAVYNQEELQKEWGHFLNSKTANYAVNSVLRFRLEIEESNLYSVQCVSKNFDKRVIGFFEAKLDRFNNIVEGLFIVHFNDKDTFVFMKDLSLFIDELFVHYGFEKIVFLCVKDNPANAIFKKYLKNYKNGRHVGFFKNHYRKENNQYLDVNIYELFKHKQET